MKQGAPEPPEPPKPPEPRFIDDNPSPSPYLLFVVVVLATSFLVVWVFK